METEWMKTSNEIKEIKKEIVLLDDMLSSLVNLLEEKGILTQEEWENQIEKRLKGKPSTNFEGLKE